MDRRLLKDRNGGQRSKQPGELAPRSPSGFVISEPLTSRRAFLSCIGIDLRFDVGRPYHLLPGKASCQVCSAREVIKDEIRCSPASSSAMIYQVCIETGSPLTIASLSFVCRLIESRPMKLQPLTMIVSLLFPATPALLFSLSLPNSVCNHEKITSPWLASSISYLA